MNYAPSSGVLSPPAMDQSQPAIWSRGAGPGRSANQRAAELVWEHNSTQPFSYLAWTGRIFKQDRESRIIMGWNKEYRSQGMLIPNTISFYGILLESKLRSLSKLTVRLSHFMIQNKNSSRIYHDDANCMVGTGSGHSLV